MGGLNYGMQALNQFSTAQVARNEAGIRRGAAQELRSLFPNLGVNTLYLGTKDLPAGTLFDAVKNYDLNNALKEFLEFNNQQKTNVSGSIIEPPSPNLPPNLMAESQGMPNSYPQVQPKPIMAPGFLASIANQATPPTGSTFQPNTFSSLNQQPQQPQIQTPNFANAAPPFQGQEPLSFRAPSVTDTAIPPAQQTAADNANSIFTNFAMANPDAAAKLIPYKDLFGTFSSLSQIGAEQAKTQDLLSRSDTNKANTQAETRYTTSRAIEQEKETTSLDRPIGSEPATARDKKVLRGGTSYPDITPLDEKTAVENVATNYPEVKNILGQGWSSKSLSPEQNELSQAIRALVRQQVLVGKDDSLDSASKLQKIENINLAITKLISNSKASGVLSKSADSQGGGPQF